MSSMRQTGEVQVQVRPLLLFMSTLALPNNPVSRLPRHDDDDDNDNVDSMIMLGTSGNSLCMSLKNKKNEKQKCPTARLIMVGRTMTYLPYVFDEIIPYRVKVVDLRNATLRRIGSLREEGGGGQDLTRDVTLFLSINDQLGCSCACGFGIFHIHRRTRQGEKRCARSTRTMILYTRKMIKVRCPDSCDVYFGQIFFAVVRKYGL